MRTTPAEERRCDRQIRGRQSAVREDRRQKREQKCGDEARGGRDHVPGPERDAQNPQGDENQIAQTRAGEVLRVAVVAQEQSSFPRFSPSSPEDGSAVSRKGSAKKTRASGG